MIPRSKEKGSLLRPIRSSASFEGERPCDCDKGGTIGEDT